VTAFFYRDACLTAGELIAAAAPGIPCPAEVARRARQSAASMRLLRELMAADSVQPPRRPNGDE